MTENPPEQSQPDTSAPGKAPASAAPADPAPAETVRLFLVPDAFTYEYVAHMDGGSVSITTRGADVPAAEAAGIIETAAGLGVVLKEED